MFGIIRPCAHRLAPGPRAEWTAHLCGLCLALRGEHGQAARLLTNYDALLVSVLVDAQTGPVAGRRRTAGPCPLRGMRTAPVARGEGARPAAAVSMVLAAAKVRDHVADGDGALSHPLVARAARRLATGWDRAGARSGGAVGFDTAVLVDAVDRQAGIEAAVRPGGALLAVTEPTETATAAAFAHTAHLAGRPDNAAPLAEAGRLFGRPAHLLDAVEDLPADTAAGAFNPIVATGRDLAEARRLCDDAVRGIALALRDVRFADDRLAHVLLVHEPRRSVDRAFGAGCAHTPSGGPTTPGRHAAPPPPPPLRRRGLLAGCAVWTGLLCSCQLCCASSYADPWTEEEREGLCHRPGCECCGDGCCACCDCGNLCSPCGCGRGDGCCDCCGCDC
ncbi:DUF5685 family protein [Streptomyces sp. ST2-7A]|uniref:DUF5685 family protein n=1 Tax=Streptomyces sp. ST2-7A TaxID=2907214 RepID=UPI001F16532B|nr:DUF5685 family protein [Streptomyces sp. ST2-7A]MCE7081819.1 DUF5685 family protein [Streptomyces sp. ST2-7A]